MILLSVNWGNALIITFVGFFIVVFLLIFLVGVVSCFGVVAKKTAKRKPTQVVETEKETDGVSDGEYAAIAMALHLYLNQHDEESDVITIKNIDRRYSPWSSKIYGINEI